MTYQKLDIKTHYETIHINNALWDKKYIMIKYRIIIKLSWNVNLTSHIDLNKHNKGRIT